MTEFRNDTDEPLDVALMGQRTEFPAAGFAGASAGGIRSYTLNGEPVSGKGRFSLDPGDIITMYEAGGGGFGDPGEREPQRVLRDVLEGHVSVEGALEDYGVSVDPATGTATRR